MTQITLKMPPSLGNNQNILQGRFGARRSTPDSEALASSDDDVDRSETQHQPGVLQKPTLRATWLPENSQGPSQVRKSSFASSMSPTGSPATESGPCSASLGRGSYPWGTAGTIWNNDNRKEPPSRLTEVLPSPTSGRPPSSGLYSAEAQPRDSLLNTIPFAIPLHPTPKTYRSQSYSVGQQDPALPGAPGVGAGAGTSQMGSRARNGQHTGLQHRPSRPSMLGGELSSDRGLGRLSEDEDDQSTQSSGPGYKAQASEAETIKKLTRENAMLRQQQQQQQQQSRLRPRASTSSMFAPMSAYGLPGALPEESEFAVDEEGEPLMVNDMKTAGLARRMSEFGTAPSSRLLSLGVVENRNLENAKKSLWQTSLGFGGDDDASQSRRHSFANDIPTRHGSIGSAGEPQSAREARFPDALGQREYQQRMPEGAHYNLNHANASYFAAGTLARGPDPYMSPPYQTPSFGGQGPFANGRASPHRNVYGAAQPRYSQPLYIVLFKCSRADVFYVQEGTGLSIKPGDLVIVEADRGTDLGTVAKHNVDWTTAKDLKEHYAEEHYKWLMMYSQGAAGNADGTGAGLMATTTGLQSSAIGGMGPQNPHGAPEATPGDIKPKIIKRLAQAHEIQALRDKEGNEAKAKRVCMQKVKEHGLHMEILDAEFQMDWKKLTFYYFADAYINFNSLVTDLFKVYKTRIWMSAINPASFASPALGLQAPSGVGPGAVGASRNAQAGARQPPNEQRQTNYNTSPIVSSYQKSFAPPFASTLERAAVAATPFQPSGYPYYPAFGDASRNMAAAPVGYMGGPSLDTFLGFPGATEYPGMQHPPGMASAGSEGAFSQGRNAMSSPSEAWVNSFQGLSMNHH